MSNQNSAHSVTVNSQNVEVQYLNNAPWYITATSTKTDRKRTIWHRANMRDMGPLATKAVELANAERA